MAVNYQLHEKGDILDENDIVRFADQYNRVTKDNSGR